MARETNTHNFSYLCTLESRHMCEKCIFILEWLLAMVANVAKMAREVETFNVFPEVIQMMIFLPTQGALVA